VSAARIDEGASATFTFTMESSVDAVNWLNYGSIGEPTVVIRWQEVGYNDREGSSAGYGWLDTGGTVPPVPEPRLIAPLAVFGLGGLLVLRRRIRRKAKKA
jgi:MYXO-CTERM domain-containing protein